MIADNDHETPPPQTCPLCGRPYPLPFDLRTSGLLDLVLIAKEALSDVQAVLEEEVLP